MWSALISLRGRFTGGVDPLKKIVSTPPPKIVDPSKISTTSPCQNFNALTTFVKAAIKLICFYAFFVAN
jgi:hypothetical protein